jgi:hypothetical protein
MGGGETLERMQAWSLLKPSAGPNRVTCGYVYLLVFASYNMLKRVTTRSNMRIYLSIQVYGESIADGWSDIILPPKSSRIRPPMTVKHMVSKRLNICLSLSRIHLEHIHGERNHPYEF